MLKKISMISMILLIGVCSVQAADITFSTSGTIGAGDTYDGVGVINDGTVVDMTGGQIGGLWLYDDSRFNMSGGDITGGVIHVGALSSFNILNGIVDIGEFILEGESCTLIQGGQISAGRMKAYYDCMIDIKGGVLQLDSFDMVGFNELPTINIYGYGFNYNPTGGAYEGILTGYLMDGNLFSIDNISEFEYLRFNLIPEPTTLLLFSLGGLFLRKRKRN